MTSLLPSNPIILPVIRGAAPETAVLPIEVDRIDRTAGAITGGDFITHVLQFIPY